MKNKKMAFVTNILLTITGVVAFSNLIFIDSDQLNLLGLVLYGLVTLLLVIENYKEKKVFSIVLILVFIYLCLAYLPTV